MAVVWGLGGGVTSGCLDKRVFPFVQGVGVLEGGRLGARGISVGASGVQIFAAGLRDVDGFGALPCFALSAHPPRAGRHTPLAAGFASSGFGANVFVLGLSGRGPE